MWSLDQRRTRRHNAGGDDQRERFARDRDRILYSSAFRRLAGVTQIVKSGEADVFHTRQQHTLKVAQVGRRLAELLLNKNRDLCEHLGVNAEVVEAACLAHDLGHPPFGHIGEHTLHDLVVEHDPDGFEGNAQTFRILTKLAVRYELTDGLDLTRATLAACLKYPWLRDPNNVDRSKKWGAYRSDLDDFEFAREYFRHSAKTAEAALMDWADDIAYSVHDLEDFHRCGMIPWHRIVDDEDLQDGLKQRVVGNWHRRPSDADARIVSAIDRIKSLLLGSVENLVRQPYEGNREQRQQLRTLTSSLIGRFIVAASLAEPDASGVSVHIAQDEHDEVLVLKQITRDYIINNPALVAQQKGYQRIIERLFDDLYLDSRKNWKPPAYLPVRLMSLWNNDEPNAARFAADCISGLTEAEAIALASRLQGTTSGSVLDPIVR